MQVWDILQNFFFQSTSTSITLLYIKNSVKMSREILIHFVNEETGKQGLSGFPKITHQVDGKVKTGFHVSWLLSSLVSFFYP